MTLIQLITAVRNMLDDPNLSADLITPHLNDAQRELSKMSSTRTLWSVSVSSGDEYVSKPDDVLIPKNMFFDYGNQRYELDIYYGIPPEQGVTGLPDCVYVIGDDIYFYPIPSQSGTLKILGIARPVDMVDDNDTPSIKDADGVLIAYAAWMLALMDESDPRVNQFKDIYDQKKYEWSILNAMANPMSSTVGHE